jgi:hypothetical protein
MPDDLILRRALNILRRPIGGDESLPGDTSPAPERVSMLYEHARAAIGLAAESRLSRLDAARAEFAAALLEEGRGALAEVAAKGLAASLTTSQSSGLEAIVRLTGRPSLLIQDGTFAQTTPEWNEPLLAARAQIENVLTRVGRVNLPEIGSPGYVGTAFLAGADLALTNRHVAMLFAQSHQGGWRIRTGYTPSVDVQAEHDRAGSQEHRVLDIVDIHPDPLVDLALLRLAPQSSGGSRLPAPLALNSDRERIAVGRQVYVIGYPAYDPRNDASALNQIFGNVFFVKRLAPGEIIGAREQGLQLTHDCSTLGGNSGSCVVDFSTHRVLGLHFSGTYLEENRAASIAHLDDDPIVSGRGLNYV